MYFKHWFRFGLSGSQLLLERKVQTHAGRRDGSLASRGGGEGERWWSCRVGKAKPQAADLGPHPRGLSRASRAVPGPAPCPAHSPAGCTCPCSSR